MEKVSLDNLRIERKAESTADRAPIGKILGWIAAVIVLGVALFALYTQWIAPSRLPEPELMTVKRMTNTANPPLLTASGYLVADRQATISPKMAGRVVRLGFDIGSNVRRGQVLAVLESEDLLAQVDEAAAALNNAQLEYNRQRAMYEQGVSSRALLDAAEAQLRITRARVARGKVALTDNVVRAPFDGTITAKNTEVGEVISPYSVTSQGSSQGGGSIATLADLNSMEMDADVNESNLSQLRLSQPAEITVDAFPGRKWRARVRRIVPRADRAKGVVQVKLEILDPKEGLLPEMSASAAFLGQERTASEIAEKPKIWVPAAAVGSDGGGPFIAVVKDGRVERRRITSGQTREGRIEILQGLNEGETIITRDVATYKDGARVKVPKSS
jgi:HlyD family secretion protein